MQNLENVQTLEYHQKVAAATCLTRSSKSALLCGVFIVLRLGFGLKIQLTSDAGGLRLKVWE